MERLRSSDGFTLSELLTVVSIIGLLAAIALPNFMGGRAQAKAKDAIASLETARTHLTAFARQAERGEEDAFPDSFTAQTFKQLVPDAQVTDATAAAVAPSALGERTSFRRLQVGGRYQQIVLTRCVENYDAGNRLCMDLAVRPYEQDDVRRFYWADGAEIATVTGSEWPALP